MEAEVGDNVSVYLQEAIDFIKEVERRLKDRREHWELFLHALCRLGRGYSTERAYNTVTFILSPHPDLLRLFEGFLPHRKPFSQTGSSEHDQRALEAIESRAQDFLADVSRRLRFADFLVFVEEIHRCWVQDFDMNKTRTVIEKYIGQFPDLMEEFEDFWNKSMQVKASVFKKKREDTQSTSSNNVQ